MAIIAIDFDGTIVEHEFPMIIIWTCRTSQNEFPEGEPTIFHVEKFLRENDIPFDTINHNIPGKGFQPSPNVYADFYIDDKNLGGFIPWKEAYDLITIQLKARELGLE